MAATALTSTTITAALSANAVEFELASITGVSVGSVLGIRDEAMQVQSVVGTRVRCRRGMSSRARSHPRGSKVWIGTESQFKVLVDGAIGLGADAGDLPDYLFPGRRMRDGAGSEFILVDLTGDVFSGTPVQINSDYTAAKIGITGRGAFGVAAEQGSSDQWVWVQIYGRCKVQLLGATAGVSPSDDANGPTTLSTTAQTKFWLPTTATSAGPEGARWTSGNVSTTSGFYIARMYVAHDASPSNDVSAVTAATSHTGSEVGVFLNYPEIVHVNVGE